MVEVKLNPEHGSMAERAEKRRRPSNLIAEATFHDAAGNGPQRTHTTGHGGHGGKQRGEVRKGEPSFAQQTAGKRDF